MCIALNAQHNTLTPLNPPHDRTNAVPTTPASCQQQRCCHCLLHNYLTNSEPMHLTTRQPPKCPVRLQRNKVPARCCMHANNLQHALPAGARTHPRSDAPQRVHAVKCFSTQHAPHDGTRPTIPMHRHPSASRAQRVRSIPLCAPMHACSLPCMHPLPQLHSKAST